jgi:hypothetical protein
VRFCGTDIRVQLYEKRLRINGEGRKLKQQYFIPTEYLNFVVDFS